MADINEIAVTYRQHLARLPKHNTRTDYSKCLAMLMVIVSATYPTPRTAGTTNC